MPLLNAKCTNCGAILKVDSDKDAAVCEHCGSAFIVEKGINEYKTTNINANTVNINNGPSVENLLARGREYEQRGSFEKAIKYYNDVLDIEFDNVEAREGMDRIKDVQDNAVLMSESVVKYGREKGSAVLTKRYLRFDGNKGSISFEVSQMRDVCAKENMNYMGVGGLGRPIPNCLYFTYEGQKQWLFCRSGHARNLADMINDINSKHSSRTLNNIFAED